MEKNEILKVDIKVVQTIAEVYQALDTIEVRGFVNTKTLSNCMEAIKQCVEIINQQNPTETPSTEKNGDSVNKETKNK